MVRNALDAAPIASGASQVSIIRGRRHKYGAVRTEVDGIKFASKAEARRYCELKLLEKAGEIRRLALQPGFDLTVHGDAFVKTWLPTKIGAYVADFYYEERVETPAPNSDYWRRVVEDVKGFKTPLYRWKKKHVEAQYGIEIREVR
jgi:hypothetical protein